MRLLRAFLVGLLMALLVCLSACGDSDSVRKPGTSTVVLTAENTASPSTPISAIEVTFALPDGMSVATTGSTSEQISASVLAAGAGLNGTNLVSGRYSASSRTARLAVVTSSDNYTGGEFLRLTCNVNAGTNRLNANTPVAVVRAVGYDPTAKSTVTLTNSIRVTLAVR